MIIIVEGPDYAGKTTFAEFIARHTAGAFGIVHCGPPETDSYFDEMCAKYMIAQHLPTVFDRSHLGERVYGPIFRGGPAMEPGEDRILERMLGTFNTVVVKCIPDAEWMLQGWYARAHPAVGKPQEMFKDEKKIRQTMMAFVELETILPTLVLSTPATEVQMERTWHTVRQIFNAKR